MILGTDNNKPWGKWDLLLAEAYTIFQNERCSQCGLPIWICHNEDDSLGIEFSVVKDVCFAKAKIDGANQAEQKKSGGKGYSPPKGVTLRPRYISSKGAEFGLDMREGYYVAAQKKREQMAGSR